MVTTRPAHRAPSAVRRARTRRPRVRTAAPGATGAGPQAAPPRVESGTRSALPAVVGLTVRLLRRGALVLAAALAVYAVLEVQAFLNLYPDEASRELVARFRQDPAVRVLTGRPAGTSIGALVVWDNGWMVQLVVGAWAVVTTSRLLRGDEDAGRTDLLLAAPVRARSLVLAQLGVVAAACVLVGASLGVTLAASGTDGWGSTLYAAQVVGFATTYAALAAVLCQVVTTRGRAVGIASGALLAAFLLRMVGNSADSREWVWWLTPLGWNDHLAPYGADNAQVLLVPLVTTVLLGVVAVMLRVRRDSRAALLTASRTASSHLLGLSSPLAFAARSTVGTLAAWAGGLAAFGVIGAMMIPAMEEFIASDPGYAELLAAFGFDLADVTLGYLAVLGAMSGVALSLYAVWRIGAARAEEAAERVELFLVRPVTRGRWLGGHLVLAVASVVLLAVVMALTTWVTAVVVGADVALADAVAAMVNPLPATAVLLGAAVLLLGVAPRLVVPVGATSTMLLYVLELVGPALEWPEWVLGLSPFHHVAAVPVEDVATTATLTLLGIAAALVVAGVVAFRRRDLQGG